MLYSLYKFGSFLSRILPIKVCYFLAEVIARLYFRVARCDKGFLRENLKVVLGDGVGQAELDRHVRKVFINFAKYLADFFKFSKLTEEDIYKCAEVVGRDHLDECLARGKGAVLLSAHLGNWELGGAAVSAMGYPLNAIVLEHADKRINGFFSRRRERNNLKTIPLGIKVKQCFKALAGNEFLAIVGDKDYSGSNRYVKFFGKKTYMPKGAAVISLRTGAPIVVTTVVRKKDDTFRLAFEQPIFFDGSGDADRDVELLMRQYLEKIEKYIYQYPDQWYAFNRIWKQE